MQKIILAVKFSKYQCKKNKIPLQNNNLIRLPLFIRRTSNQSPLLFVIYKIINKWFFNPISKFKKNKKRIKTYKSDKVGVLYFSYNEINFIKIRFNIFL